MKKTNQGQARLLGALSLIGWTLATTSTAHAQWNVSADYNNPTSSYLYSADTLGGAPADRSISNWLTQYTNPLSPIVTPPNATVRLPGDLSANNIPIAWGNRGAWDDWKPLLTSSLSRKNFLDGARQLNVFAVVHLTITWDTVKYGPAPPNAVFEMHSYVNQYKSNLPNWSPGRSIQDLDSRSPEEPLFFANMHQETLYNFWTTASPSAVIYGGGNTSWSSPITFIDANHIAYYDYIKGTQPYTSDELYWGDAWIHGGRVRIPITNGSANVNMNIHQQLFLDQFALTANSETESKASTEFRIIPN
jgi:hypothetical protein